MAVAYPLDFPTSPGIKSITWRAVSNNIYNEGLYSGIQTVSTTNHLQWFIDITLPPMKEVDAEGWVSFLISLRGRFGTFNLKPYRFHGSKIGQARPGGLVNGANQLGSVITTDGWRANVLKLFKRGDFISINSVLYKVMLDIDSDSSGNATISIWPDLQEAISDDSTIEIENPTGLFRLTTDNISFNINEAKHYGLNFSAQMVL